MSRIKCVIIDDPHSANVLEMYISELNTLERIATFTNPVDALMYLQHTDTDLLFLKTHFQDITGGDFLHLVPARPKVVFLLDAGKRWNGSPDGQVLGCMSKPLRYEQFLENIEECQRCIPPVQRSVSPAPIDRDGRTGGRFLYFLSGKALIKVLLHEILYIEAVKRCARIRTKAQNITVDEGMSEIQARLPEGAFLRIHRSFIVATDKITALNDCSVEINHCILPVARQYHGKVMKLLRLGRKDV